MDRSPLGDLLECPVCLDPLGAEHKVLPCQHTFCTRCLLDVREKRRRRRKEAGPNRGAEEEEEDDREEELICPECRSDYTTRTCTSDGCW